VIDAMRFSSEPSIIAFLHVYDSTPVCDRKQIPLEAVVLKAKVDCNTLLGAIVMSYRSFQAQKVAMLAMASHPDVIKSTIKYAKMQHGERDRRMLHEAVGFLPTPKGASINFNFPQNQDEQEEAPEVDVPPDVDDLFPLVSSRQEKWQNNRQKLLTDSG